jgi:hypothetical protein
LHRCISRFSKHESLRSGGQELAARLDADADSTMLLTAISDAVERYDTECEAVVMIESEKGFEVSVVTPTGGLFYDPSEG